MFLLGTRICHCRVHIRSRYLCNFNVIDYEKNIIVMNDRPHKIETPNSIHIWAVPEEQ